MWHPLVRLGSFWRTSCRIQTPRLWIQIWKKASLFSLSSSFEGQFCGWRQQKGRRRRLEKRFFDRRLSVCCIDTLPLCIGTVHIVTLCIVTVLYWHFTTVLCHCAHCHTALSVHIVTVLYWHFAQLHLSGPAHCTLHSATNKVVLDAHTLFTLYNRVSPEQSGCGHKLSPHCHLSQSLGREEGRRKNWGFAHSHPLRLLQQSVLALFYI